MSRRSAGRERRIDRRVLGDGGGESLRRGHWLGYAYTADAAWASADSRDEFPETIRSGRVRARAPRSSRGPSWSAGSCSPPRAISELLHGLLRSRSHTVALWLARMDTLAIDMADARANLRSAERTVNFNREGLDVLDLTASRFAYAANRERVLERLATVATERRWASMSNSDRERELAPLAGLRDSSVVSAARYERLWLRDNRAPMLAPLLERMASQARELDRLLTAARAEHSSPRARVTSRRPRAIRHGPRASDRANPGRASSSRSDRPTPARRRQTGRRLAPGGENKSSAGAARAPALYRGIGRYSPALKTKVKSPKRPRPAT